MSKITYPLVPDTTENSFMGFLRDDKNGTMFVGEGSWGAHPRANDDDKPWTLTSSSCNQVKWVHVLPKSGNEDAHMKIYTLISATYDNDDKQTLHNLDIEALSEENFMVVPQNIELCETGTSRQYVRYPFIDE